MSGDEGGTHVPTLSILCLAYNHEAFIAQALESFVAQVTRFEVEIVVADDCSGDRTTAVVEGFAARIGPQLRLLRSPVNLGVTRNLRHALPVCRGRYIAVCEGDDYWQGRDKLQTQVDYLEAHPDVVLTFHDAVVVDADGRTHGVQIPPWLRRDATSAELQATRPISTLTVCFRNVLDALPPELDQAPALDLCLWSLLGHHGSGKYLPEIEPAIYRVHGGGAFSMQGDRNRYLMTAQSLLCLARLYARLDQPELSERLLRRATVLAGSRLGFLEGLRATPELILRIAIRLAQRVARRFRMPRKAP